MLKGAENKILFQIYFESYENNGQDKKKFWLVSG